MSHYLTKIENRLESQLLRKCKTLLRCCIYFHISRASNLRYTKVISTSKKTRKARVSSATDRRKYELSWILAFSSIGWEAVMTVSITILGYYQGSQDQSKG